MRKKKPSAFRITFEIVVGIIAGCFVFMAFLTILTMLMVKFG